MRPRVGAQSLLRQGPVDLRGPEGDRADRDPELGRDAGELGQDLQGIGDASRVVEGLAQQLGMFGAPWPRQPRRRSGDNGGGHFLDGLIDFVVAQAEVVDQAQEYSRVDIALHAVAHSEEVGLKSVGADKAQNMGGAQVRGAVDDPPHIPEPVAHEDRKLPLPSLGHRHQFLKRGLRGPVSPGAPGVRAPYDLLDNSAQLSGLGNGRIRVDHGQGRELDQLLVLGVTIALTGTPASGVGIEDRPVGLPAGHHVAQPLVGAGRLSEQFLSALDGQQEVLQLCGVGRPRRGQCRCQYLTAR